MSEFPSIAIIGRPNVGKSTLFNRLVGKRIALVHDLPGVTRDRQESAASLSDLRFNLVDTAGLDSNDDELSKKIWQQTQKAIDGCEIVLFIIDARAGVTEMDKHYANLVRKANKTVILVANKCESSVGQASLPEASALGLGDPIPLSAAHGQGLIELFEALNPYLPRVEKTPKETSLEDTLQLAIVGRPNVGKSTLINRLLGEERLLTADQPGVTRDTITLDWQYKGRPIQLIDTAGMRRRTKVYSQIEKLAVQDGLNAVDFAQVVVLVLDHETPLAKQDLVIANKAIDEGRILIIAINKWDLIKNKKEYLKEVEYRLADILSQVKGIPLVPISAKTGANLDKLMRSVTMLYEKWNTRVSTGQLNRWLKDVTEYHPPPLAGRNRINIKYMTQIKTRPPAFALFVSKPKELPGAYVRYLFNSLRDTFDLPGVPIRVALRGGKNPYVKD